MSKAGKSNHKILMQNRYTEYLSLSHGKLSIVFNVYVFDDEGLIVGQMNQKITWGHRVTCKF